MYETPFFVKLSRTDVSFHDFHGGLTISGDQVKEVREVTPLTKNWLQNGGLIQCDEDGNPFTLSVAAAKKTKPTPAGVAKTKTQPKSDVSKEPSVDSGEEENGEPSLEDLLNGK